MKSTREIRHEQTMEIILDAARHLILEQGYENISLREIAKRVNYSPAGLYEYFNSKDDLILVLSKRAQERLYKSLKKREETAGKNLLLALGEAYVSFALHNKEDFLLLFSRIKSKRKNFDEKPGTESAYHLLFTAIEKSLKNGTLVKKKNITIEEVAYGFWSIVHGQAMLQLTHLNDFNADFAAADRKILDAYLHGLQ